MGRATPRFLPQPPSLIAAQSLEIARIRTSTWVGVSCRTHASSSLPMLPRHMGHSLCSADHCRMHSLQYECVQCKLTSALRSMQMMHSSSALSGVFAFPLRCADRRAGRQLTLAKGLENKSSVGAHR